MDKPKKTFATNKVKVEYAQGADDVYNDVLQFLEISTEDAGTGMYYVLKTERWAVHDTSEVIALLKDFQARIVPIVEQSKKPQKTIKEVASHQRAARATASDFTQALHLLRSLADLQNGAPLQRDKAEWEITMQASYAFLNKWQC